MMTVSELSERLSELGPGGAFLVNGLRVSATLYNGGQPVKLQLAEAASYLIVLLDESPVDARPGVTNLEIG